MLTAAANRCAAGSRGRSQTWIDSRRAAGAVPMTWAVLVNGIALPGSGVAAGPACTPAAVVVPAALAAAATGRADSAAAAPATAPSHRDLGVIRAMVSVRYS